MPTKVVIDTNLLIDGESDEYNFGNRIIELVLAGKIQAFANKSTLRENLLLTHQKISDPEYAQKLTEYFDAVQEVPRLSEKLTVVEDEEDNKILESAVASQADYLITSDKHLLVLENFQGIKIVPPSQFWSEYGDESGDTWQNWLKDFITD